MSEKVTNNPEQKTTGPKEHKCPEERNGCVFVTTDSSALVAHFMEAHRREVDKMRTGGTTYEDIMAYIFPGGN